MNREHHPGCDVVVFCGAEGDTRPTCSCAECDECGGRGYINPFSPHSFDEAVYYYYEREECFVCGGIGMVLF